MIAHWETESKPSAHRGVHLKSVAPAELAIRVRAGGNGTAGTAMAVPVFEGEKWRRLDSNLVCVMECPLRALHYSLGRLRGL